MIVIEHGINSSQRRQSQMAQKHLNSSDTQQRSSEAETWNKLSSFRKEKTSTNGSQSIVSYLPRKANIAVDFFNQVNMLYSTVTEFCSPTACPTMSAGQRYEYLWADPTPNKSRGEPLKMSAPEYVDTLMTYIQSRIDDEATFPSKIGAPFPRGFMDVVKTIWRRLFRVYAHVYCEHFSVIVGLGLESHLNTSFKHFVLFAKQFEYPVLGYRLI